MAVEVQERPLVGREKVKASSPLTVVRNRLVEGFVHSKYFEEHKDRWVWNLIHNTVKLHRSEAVGEIIKEELAKGNMPCGVSSHDGHLDGAAFGMEAEDMLDLWSQIDIALNPRRFPLQGAVAPMAISWASGHQGIHLKTGYEFLKPIAEVMGLYTINHTRPKDVREFGFPKEAIPLEKEEFEGWINAGYMPLLLPQATVDAGRTRPGATNKKDIKGASLVRNNIIRDTFDLTNNVAKSLTGGEAFFVLLSSYGSFEYVDASEERIKPVMTRKGMISLALAALNLPTVLPQVETTVAVLTRKEVIADLSPGGLRDRMAMNNYIMKKIYLSLPPHVRGAYA